eukprot:sb/3475708/
MYNNKKQKQGCHCIIINDVGKQPIRTRYLGHVTYPPIRDQYFLIGSKITIFHADNRYTTDKILPPSIPVNRDDEIIVEGHQEPTDTSKQPIRTRHLGHVTGCQLIRDQYFLIRSAHEGQELGFC